MDDIGLVPGSLFFWFLLVCGCGLVGVNRRYRPDWKRHACLFVVAFVLRFLCSVTIYQFGLVNILGDEDASGWVNGAVLLESWQQEGLDPFQLPFRVAELFGPQRHDLTFLIGTHRAHYYLLASVFYLTGSPTRMIAATMNGFLGAMTTVFVYRTALDLWPRNVADRVGIWTCFFPSMVIWSSMTLKEPIIIFLESVALYYCVRMRTEGVTLGRFLTCMLLAVSLYHFRFYAAYVAGAAAVASAVVPRNRGALHPIIIRALSIFSITLLFVVGWSAVLSLEKEVANIERVTSYRNAVSTGVSAQGAGSGVRMDYDLKTPGGLFMSLAVGGAHLLLAPFPWQLRSGSLRLLLTFPELVYWWYLFFAGVLTGFVYTVRRLGLIALPIFVFLFTFGFYYSISFGNVGLVFRQRAQLLPNLFMFASVGIELRRARRRGTGPVLGPAAGVQAVCPGSAFTSGRGTMGIRGG